MALTVAVKPHPTDSNLVLVVSPYEVRSVMGGFGPARYDRDLRGYVLDPTHLGSLDKFCSVHGWMLLDERDRAPKKAGHKTWPQECHNVVAQWVGSDGTEVTEYCCQPGPLEDPPHICPACGKPWNPITPPNLDRALPMAMTECLSCGHRQRGRFLYCSNCGAAMDYPKAAPPPIDLWPKREKLAEPRVLADVMDEALPGVEAER